MKIFFSNQSVKFLEKIDENLKERIRVKIKKLVASYETDGVLPFKELGIKRLGGNWLGYMRIVLGKVRIIFKIDKDEKIIYISIIDFRGNVYN